MLLKGGLLILPLSIIIYIFLFRFYYFLLYPLATVDPYIYYAYSPGFWMVDISFWLFSPLYYLAFRKAGEGRLLSLFYMLCLDGSAVGIFLVFFSLIYGINIFASQYYTYAVFLALLFIVPVQKMTIRISNILLAAGFVIAGIIWKLVGTGNVGYFLSPSVVIDMFMIFYCFLFLYSLLSVKKKREIVKHELK